MIQKLTHRNFTNNQHIFVFYFNLAPEDVTSESEASTSAPGEETSAAGEDTETEGIKLDFVLTRRKHLVYTKTVDLV